MRVDLGPDDRTHAQTTGGHAPGWRRLARSRPLDGGGTAPLAHQPAGDVSRAARGPRAPACRRLGAARPWSSMGRIGRAQGRPQGARTTPKGWSMTDTQAPDLQPGFAAIRAARAHLKAHPAREVSETTAEDYQRTATRLIKAKIKTPTALARAYPNPRTHYHHRAAIIYRAQQNLVKALAQANQAQRAQDWPEWERLVKIITSTTRALTAFAEAPEALHKQSSASPPPRKASKRQSLPRGPWREAICSAAADINSPGAQVALETLALTGARPVELVAGVDLQLADGEIVATIPGAKVTEHAGQPWRRLYIRIDGPVAESLAAKITAAGGQLTVSAPTERRLDKWIRAADARAYPRARRAPVSAYSFRHQFAADIKAQGIPAEDVGGALGHRTDAMQRQYGHRNQGGRGGAVAPLAGLEVAEPVKHKPRGPEGPEPAPAPAEGGLVPPQP